MTWYNVTVDCDKSKMYSVYLNATTHIANSCNNKTPPNEITKIYLVNKRSQRRKRKRNKKLIEKLIGP